MWMKFPSKPWQSEWTKTPRQLWLLEISKSTFAATLTTLTLDISESLHIHIDELQMSSWNSLSPLLPGFASSPRKIGVFWYLENAWADFEKFFFVWKISVNNDELWTRTPVVGILSEICQKNVHFRYIIVCNFGSGSKFKKMNISVLN